MNKVADASKQAEGATAAAIAFDIENPVQPTGPQWIKTLYHKNERMEEIRNYGHDCIQHAGDMIYVPDQWAHMVVNIGDTVAIVSERGLENSSAET